MTDFNILFQSLIRSMKSLIKDVHPSATKPEHNFYLDIVFGILKSGSLVLNDIAYALNETISLKKVNTRLYKNLNKSINFTKKVNYIKTALSYMDDDNLVFLVDDSDVAKPYGKAFENLDYVRDASKKDAPLVLGYRLTSIVGLSDKTKHPLSLYTRIHNVNEKNYKSTNNITNIGLLRLFPFLTPESSLFVFDRGYDDTKLMTLINTNNQHFLVRMRKNRTIYVKNKKLNAFFEAANRKGKIVVPLIYRGEPTTLKVSHIEVKINNYSGKVTLLFVNSFVEKEPLILLSNRKVHSKEDVVRLTLNYISRWKIEEFFRFKKVEFGLENFRVKSLISINNICYFLDLACLFLTHIIESKHQNYFYTQLMLISKKIKDQVSIEYYQLYSALKRVFTSNRKGVKNYKQTEKWEYEKMSLFNSLELTDKKRVRIKKRKSS